MILKMDQLALLVVQMLCFKEDSLEISLTVVTNLTRWCSSIVMNMDQQELIKSIINYLMHFKIVITQLLGEMAFSQAGKF